MRSTYNESDGRDGRLDRIDRDGRIDRDDRDDRNDRPKSLSDRELINHKYASNPFMSNNQHQQISNKPSISNPRILLQNTPQVMNAQGYPQYPTNHPLPMNLNSNNPNLNPNLQYPTNHIHISYNNSTIAPANYFIGIPPLNSSIPNQHNIYEDTPIGKLTSNGVYNTVRESPTADLSKFSEAKFGNIQLKK